ncbi:unnamed protein product, partial [Mesorhabditis belari]|uniref:ATP synthase F0 subunit 8 n=1 Tax=Mesorhabditis belari TaxID=2138241 RepID=A0AAF3EWM4_9BILA
MVACADLYLLIYLSPIFSIAAFLMTLLVAWVTNTHRGIVSDVQIKSICLIDDYLQVLVPRGIAKRLKQDDFLNVDEATKADRTGLGPSAGAPK